MPTATQKKCRERVLKGLCAKCAEPLESGARYRCKTCRRTHTAEQLVRDCGYRGPGLKAVTEDFVRDAGLQERDRLAATVLCASLLVGARERAVRAVVEAIVPETQFHKIGPVMQRLRDNGIWTDSDVLPAEPDDVLFLTLTLSVICGQGRIQRKTAEDGASVWFIAA